MIKIFNLILLLIVVIIKPSQSQNLNYLKTCVNKKCFDTRIADNPFTRNRGLKGETQLPEDEGMLFLFPHNGKPGFWMKGTKIPLDILFINEEDIIVYTVKNAQPCEGDDCPIYKPTRDSSKVLEINGGLSKKFNINVGQEVQYFIEDE